MKIYEDCFRKQNTMTINLKQGEKMLPKRQEITSIDEGVEKEKLLCTADGNVNWCSHYEKQYKDFSKTLKLNCHMIQ